MQLTSEGKEIGENETKQQKKVAEPSSGGSNLMTRDEPVPDDGLESEEEEDEEEEDESEEAQEDQEFPEAHC